MIPGTQQIPQQMGMTPMMGQPQMMMQPPQMMPGMQMVRPGYPHPMAAPMYAQQVNPQQQYQSNMIIDQMQILNIQGPGRGGIHNKQKRKERMNELPSLYVTNLPKEGFLDLDFYKYFQNRGYNLKSAKIVLDSRTSKSRGYGYLQFVSQAEADRCLSEMNNHVINGHTLRIVPSSANPKEQFNQKANLYVQNIEKDVTQQELFDLFKTKGNILSCKLETYPDQKGSRGYAYVQYKTEEEAEAALAELNGYSLKGKNLEIKRHEKKEKSQKHGAELATVKPSNNLFVKNLPAGTDDAKLADMFSGFGPIESTKVQRDEQGVVKDYGFVCFKNQDDAKKALDEMNLKSIGDGKLLIVNYFVSKKENSLTQGTRFQNPINQNMTQTFKSNIYVKFIPTTVTQEELQKVFSNFTYQEKVESQEESKEKTKSITRTPTILQVKLTPSVKRYGDIEVTPYQYAFILYDTVQAAQKAIQLFDGQYTFGGTRPLQVEMWVSKDEQEQEKKRREERQTRQIFSELIGAFVQPGTGYQQQRQPGHYQQQPYGGQGGHPGQQNPRGHYQHGGRGGKNFRGGRGGYNKSGHQQRGHSQNNQQQHQQAAIQGFIAQMQFTLPLPQVNAADLDAIQDPEQRKDFVGNAIYPLINSAIGPHSGRVTGMLIDENVTNFKDLLSNPAYFNSRTKEAYALLLHSLQQQAQQAQQQQLQQQQAQILLANPDGFPSLPEQNS